MRIPRGEHVTVREFAMDRFETELFIDEVEKRPAIWDIQCDDYHTFLIWDIMLRTDHVLVGHVILDAPNTAFFFSFFKEQPQ